MSQGLNYLKLVLLTWQYRVNCTQITSTVTTFQSKRTHLECGETGDWRHGCSADKSAATSIWITISEEGFQHLSKAKRGLTQY